MLLQQLALLKGFDLAALDTDSAEFVHVVTECSKLAFADREAFYGDPAFVDVPLQTLLSDDYNDSRRALVGEDASIELRAGLPDLSGPRLQTMLALAGSVMPVGPGGGEPTFAPLPEYRGDTVHLDVVDRLGQHDRGDAERRLVPKLARSFLRSVFRSGRERRCSGSPRVCHRA